MGTQLVPTAPTPSLTWTAGSQAGLASWSTCSVGGVRGGRAPAHCELVTPPPPISGGHGGLAVAKHSDRCSPCAWHRSFSPLLSVLAQELGGLMALSHGPSRGAACSCPGSATEPLHAGRAPRTRGVPTRLLCRQPWVSPSAEARAGPVCPPRLGRSMLTSRASEDLTLATVYLHKPACSATRGLGLEPWAVPREMLERSRG